MLPDDQRLILEVAKLLKVGFLQQNAFHQEDTYVPLKKQYLMLKVIDMVYERGSAAVKKGIPISMIKNDDIYNEVVKVKYSIPNNKLEMFDDVFRHIKEFYDKLDAKYA